MNVLFLCTGTDEEVDAAFVETYRILRARIEAFLALPLHELKNDRARFKAALDRIGTEVPPSIPGESR